EAERRRRWETGEYSRAGRGASDRKGGRGSRRAVGCWTSRWNGVAWPRRQIRGARGEAGSRRGRRTPPRALEAGRREKPRAGVPLPTVPQTDTGRRGEKPKVLE